VYLLESRQGGIQSSSELEVVVKNIRFKKINTTLLVLPAFFATISLILLLIGLSTLLRLGITIIPYGERSSTYVPVLEEIISTQVLLWGSVVGLAYIIASIIAVYIVLRDIREHIYNSAMVTYYYTRGVDYIGALYYLKDMLNRSTLPSPITGLILTLLTSGVAYPIILYFTEKTIRVHAVLEEEAFFKKKRTREYTALAGVVDIALVVLTLGVYMAYMGYRLAKTFNTHIDTIHSTHPEPPKTLPQPSLEPGAWMTTSGIIGIFMVFLALSTIMAYVNLYFTPQIGLGLLLSALVVRRAERRLLENIVLIYSLLILLLLGGLFTGYSGCELYRGLYENVRELSELIRFLNVWFLIAFIFINNLAISISSTLPYIGGIGLVSGVFNAGLVLGVLSAIEERSIYSSFTILAYPHTILELLAYAILLVASSKFGVWREYVKLISIGLLVLALAAIIEVFTIIGVLGTPGTTW
jgi:hypothetical protein